MSNASYIRTSITQHAAQHVISEVAREAARKGVTVAIAIMDERGSLKAYTAADGCPELPMRVAQAKGKTAALAAVDSGILAEASLQDPSMRATLLSQPSITLMGGGLVLRDGDAVIGAIGVSGGTEEEDVYLAEFGREALVALLSS